ncbi:MULTISPECIES: methyltransferase [unclassified Amycolatopsis]|uniref:methyltransferase n=1 Tax=unclassified Amycolatopsis TaxID=2618356 RepID=UPI002E14C682|nr:MULTISPECIES: methyltransferase [unclassified Amycolatopsis]WSJ74572.1 acetylserotonin O-methyltransferase [Amycolatopsis sp. NBC_01307]WSK81791.1 acetylserotonin O-methyltransferase [Amycolatopsis sp. NBC_01286]
MTTTADQGTVSAINARPLIELGTSFWAAKTLLTAVEIGLFTELGAGSASEEQLRAKLDLHPRSSRDFLDALVSLDLLEREDGLYRNTATTGYFLDEHKETFLGGWMRQASKHLFRAWGGLTESLRSGKPFIGWDTADYFERLYEDMEERRSFIAAMDAWTTHIATELADGVNWAEHKTFVDVGGARGNLSASLVKAQPHLDGVVFDRPEIAELFHEHMAAKGTTGRVGFVVGDFFTEPIPPADVLIFGHILHDWNDEERATLVRRAYESVNPGGIVVIYDRMIDDDRRVNKVGLLGCLNLLVVTPGGSEYTIADCREYASAAGFESTTTVALFDGLETAVVCRKAR